MDEKKFIKRYQEFIEKCAGKIPKIQILHELEMNPQINRPITPTPRKWFIDSFDWVIGLKLVCSASYGPFYRVDGDSFWPVIGNESDVHSEKKCFFGLEKPKDVDDAQNLYDLQSTDMAYVYEIKFEMPEWPVMEAWIFLGPVKKGKGFQVNPNSVVVELIKGKIFKGEINRYPKLDNGKYSVESEPFYYGGIESQAGLNKSSP